MAPAGALSDPPSGTGGSAPVFRKFPSREWSPREPTGDWERDGECADFRTPFAVSEPSASELRWKISRRSECMRQGGKGL